MSLTLSGKWTVMKEFRFLGKSFSWNEIKTRVFDSTNNFTLTLMIGVFVCVCVIKMV